jgi:hypothetical protein
MDRLRLAPLDGSATLTSCSRCGAGQQNWDRIANKAYCPNCQEELAQGRAEPLVERTEQKCCVVCARRGTVPFFTVPLHASAGVEMDLCGEHLRDLLGRCLGPYAYHQLRRQLRTLQVNTEAIFLLHEEFYDSNGRALRPAVEVD